MLNHKNVNDLILSNIGIVYHIVNKLCLNKTKFKDYLSYGVYGLVKAAHTYNRDRNIAFSSYASTVIRNEIIKNAIHNAIEQRTSYYLDEPIKSSISKGSDVNDFTVERLVFDDICEESTIIKKTSEIVEEYDDKLFFKKIYDYLKKSHSKKISSRDKNIYFDYTIHKTSMSNIARKHHMTKQNVSIIVNRVNNTFKDLIYKKYHINSFKCLINS
jgi:RNA polymerase sigma factor (sigma-70 family)